MSKESFKKALIGLGIPLIVVLGIATYFLNREPTMTYEQYQAIIRAYNLKAQEIMQDCDNDRRCIKVGGQPRVILGNIKDKKDLVDVFNLWIKTDQWRYIRRLFSFNRWNYDILLHL